MASIPLPALSIRPPEDPTQGIERAVALRNLLQNAPIQHQILQQQAQAAGLENQQRQLALNDQQAASAAMRQMDPSKGFDDLPGLMLKNGASAQAVIGMHQNILKYKTDAANLTKDQLANEKVKNDYFAQAIDNVKSLPVEQQPAAFEAAKQDAVTKGHLDPQQAQGLTYQGPQQLDLLEKNLMGHTAVIEQALKQSQQFKEQNQGLEAQAMTANERAKLPQIQAEAAVAPQMAQLGVTQRQTEIQKNRALTGEAIAATAKNKAETENLGQQPIFAYDPGTRTRVQTTRPEAKQLGYTNPVSVNEGAIAKERDATAMVNDVQLNTSRYRTAMQQLYSQPITHGQMTALTALTPEKLGIDIGHGFGINLPDVIQKVTNASAFSVLSRPQKEAVMGYYTTLASVPAAQKALSGIGRSNKEMLDLELRTIPTPLMDQETFDVGIDRFQGNIDQTAAKNVRIPGMPTTQDVRLQNEPAFAAQQRQGNSNNLPTISRPLSDLLNQMNTR